MQNKMTFGTCFRLCTAVVAAALLAAPSFAQAQDNRVFVELSRTTGAAGSFVEATVYIDQADPQNVQIGADTGGFNAIGASLMWMDGAFTWNVDTGGAPLSESTNLMAEGLMSAPGAMPNFELLQTVDSTGTGIFFETDSTSNAITVTLVRTDFNSVDEQIIDCVYRGNGNMDADNCDRFPIFRATLQVAEPPADMPPNMMDEFHDVMALATADAQSPSPGDGFVEMDMVDNFVMVQQTEQSQITVSSDAPGPFTLNTASSAAPRDVITLTVARSASTIAGGDGLEARPSEVVWALSGADTDSLSTLIGSLNLTLQGVIGTDTVAATATYGDVQTSVGGGASSTATFSFSTAASVDESASFTLTLRASLSESDALFDQTDYTLAFGSFAAVGQDGLQSSAPDVSAPTVSDAAVQLRVDATQLSWEVTDLGVIQAGRSISLRLLFTDAMGNIDINRADTDNTVLTDLAITTVGGTGARGALAESDGVISFFWSHSPDSDRQTFMVSAALGSFSTSVPATGVSDAVADQLNAVITVRIPDEDAQDPTIPSIISEEGNLVSDIRNGITIAFTAADCSPGPCVTDTDIDEANVTVDAVYAWMSTQVTVVTDTTLSSGVVFPLSVSFTDGEGISEGTVITPTLAEDRDEAVITLAFSVTVGGNQVTGSGMLTLVPGGPDFNFDLSGNGVAGFRDAVIFVRSGQIPFYAGRIAGFEDEVNAGNLGTTPAEREAELDRRFQALLESEEADLSGNGVAGFRDAVIFVRSGQIPFYAGRIAGFEDEVNAGNLGTTPAEREAELNRRFQALVDSATR